MKNCKSSSLLGGMAIGIFFSLFLFSLSAVNAATNDVSLKAILSPAKSKCGNPNTPITVVIGNPGTNTQTKVPVVVIMSGAGSATVIDTLFATLSSGSADTFTLYQTLNTASGGTFLITAYTNLKADADRTNDTNSISLTMNTQAIAAHIGSNSFCSGLLIPIGAAAVSGSRYKWTSKPTGFSDTTSNPSVSPKVNTTYYITETIPSPGCSKTDSLVLNVAGGMPYLYGTYFGGQDAEIEYTPNYSYEGGKMARDKFGNTYLLGATLSTSGIATKGAYQTVNAGNSDVYLAKFDCQGQLEWATYYGGTDYDYASGIVTDSSGNIFICGSSLNSNNMATKGAYQTKNAGYSDAFLAKFNSSGKLIWSTYYGGSSYDYGYGIAIDSSQELYITGTTTSTNGITTKGAYQTSNAGSGDIFLAKFTNAGAIVWATYYGGTNQEFPFGIVTDIFGNIYLTGYTGSSSGIATKGAHKTTIGGAGKSEAFLCKFDLSGSFIWGTYYGGSGTVANGVTTDTSGNVYITGSTGSISGVATKGAYRSVLYGYDDAFIAKFSKNDTLLWGTYYGGSHYNIGQGIALDDSANIYITGYTYSTNGIATKGALKKSLGGMIDGFVTKFSNTGALAWGTYYGGDEYDYGTSILTDHAGNVYMSGFTRSTTGIATKGASQETYGGGGYDDYWVKLTYPFCTMTNSISGKTSVCSNSSTFYTAIQRTGSKYQWSIMGGKIISGQYGDTVNIQWTTSGTAYLKVVEINGNCKDSTIDTITVNALPNAAHIKDTTVCLGGGMSIGASSIAWDNYAWTSKPSGFTSTSSNPTVNPLVSTTYYLTETNTISGCSTMDSVHIGINVTVSMPKGSSNSPLCSGDTLKLNVSGSKGLGYNWTGPNSFSSALLNPSIVGVKVANSGNYILRAIDSATACMSQADTVKVTVIAPPTLAIKGNTTVCSNTLQTYSAGTASSYVWSVSGGTIVSGNGTSKLTVNWGTGSSGIVKLVESNSYGCLDSLSTTVTINAMPSAKHISNTTICAGVSLKIGASAVTGNSYIWTSNPTGFSSGNSNPSVSPNTTTTYYITEIAKGTGCIKSDSVLITVNQLPSTKAGGNRTICLGDSTTLGTSAISGHSYSWTATGFSAASSSIKVSPSATITYILKETITATGCSNTDTAKVTVNSIPTVNAGKNTAICIGQSTYIGGSAGTGISYTWTSRPAGFTSSSSNPLVAPSVNTTYILTESIKTTGCSKQDSVTITVNPLPLSSITSSHAICAGSSLGLGSTAVSGHIYFWSSSPSGLSSSKANPTVTPSKNTEYYLTEYISATGCSRSDSALITINSLPAALVGNNQSICAGQNAQLGGKAITGNAYQWTSNPSGFTDSSSNPVVSPAVNTTYYLKETVLATGCIKSDSVSVKILPNIAVNTGSNKHICFGSSTSIGLASVSGNTYQWVSSPTGFTDTTSNPTVSPKATTAYILTQEVISSGCKRTDSITVFVDALPLAKHIKDSATCYGASLSIGDSSVGGNSYKWTSNPGGFSSSISNPSVSPLLATTYYLIETIIATGCQKSDSLYIDVNALPVIYTGGNRLTCAGQSISIGSASSPGKTYSWSSHPAGFSSALANPSISPVVNTTYILSETLTATGCSNMDSMNVTVNPLPSAKTGGNKSMCPGDSVQIGDTAIGGNSYSWTSKPSGFTSSLSMLKVSPTVTTIYYLTERTSATGCTKSDSLVVTVNSLPSAKTGGNQSICLGDSIQIGGTAVTGNSYSWTSSGFVSSLSNPMVHPMVNTTYYLVEKTASGCSKPDSVVIKINPLPSASTSGNKSICHGDSILIGAASVSGNTYRWTSSGFSSALSNPTIKPSATSSYYLTETISATGCKKSDSLVITVNPLPSAKTGGNQTICSGNSTSIGASSISGNTYTWKSNPTGFTSSLSNPTVSPTINTTFYLTERITGTGCSKSDSVMITVNPLPSATTGGSKSICKGDSISIGAGSISGNSYSWTSKPTGFYSSVSNPKVSPSFITTYLLTESITATGCNKTDSMIISISPQPTPKIAGLVSVCPGMASTYSTANNTGSTYKWSVGAGSILSGSGTNSISVSLKPVAKTTIEVIETNGAGCTDSISDSISILAKPTAKFLANRACLGTASIFTDSSSVHSKQKWFFGDGFTSNNILPVHTYSNTGVYTASLIIFNSLGCEDSVSIPVSVDSMPNTAHWTAKKLASKKYAFMADDTTLAFGAYTWSFGDGTNANGFHPIYSYSIDSTYIVRLSVKKGCSIYFDSSINLFTNIDKIESETFSLNIYPNPFQSSTNISYSLTKPENVKMEVFDMLGRRVALLLDERQTEGEHTQQFQSAENRAGVYILKMAIGERLITKQLTIVR